MLGGEIVLESDTDKGCMVTITLPEPDAVVQDSAQEGNMFIFDDAEQF